MFSMIPISSVLARLCAVAVAIASLLLAAPSYAADAYIASNGSGSSCTAAQPCNNFESAFDVALGSGAVARVICTDPVSDPGAEPPQVNNFSLILDIYCPGGFVDRFDFSFPEFATVRLRGLTFRGVSTTSVNILNGTLILDDCVFQENGAAALDLETNNAVNLVIKNSRISNNGSGILLKPASGGSIKATLDHVEITGNIGGGIKTDSTNGFVSVDINDSVISYNTGNGINAVAGANQNFQNMISVKNSVINKNGAVGVQANGTNAAVLLQMTLLDQNASGATSIVNGGHISTYGNNSIVGSAGSGFNGTAPLQ
jgi:hypothetical protein